jgi:hypothetical protein
MNLHTITFVYNTDAPRTGTITQTVGGSASITVDDTTTAAAVDAVFAGVPVYTQKTVVSNGFVMTISYTSTDGTPKFSTSVSSGAAMSENSQVFTVPAIKTQGDVGSLIAGAVAGFIAARG